MGNSNCYTTRDFLDMLKIKLDVETDYQLAGALDWSRSLISTYRTKPQYLGDKNCIEVADVLNLPAAFVLCCVHAERAKDAAIKEYWKDMALALDRCDGLRRSPRISGEG